MSYKIRLDIFEGPLDLLLYLIKKDDLDISKIAIKEVTEQYLQYIEMMKMLDLDVVGDFLVMAATLIQIKSRMLLPPDPEDVEEEEEDPTDELVRRLHEYKKFKEIADDLKEKELFRKDLFPRNMDEEITQQIKADAKEVFFEANLFDLINALSDALRKKPEDIIHEITQEEFTVEQKIHDLLHLMLDKAHVMVAELFSAARSKTEVIVTFLAVLELIRLNEVKIIQKAVFGDIELLRNKDNILPESASDEVQSENLEEDLNVDQGQDSNLDENSSSDEEIDQR
jgi:segregation and condensation protein A